jgi:hemin uptake protein HemP
MKNKGSAARATSPEKAGRTGLFESKQVISSRDLFFGGKEVWIEHGNELYCLRLTKQDKLILTK